jgi:tryptophan synthase alpha chain
MSSTATTSRIEARFRDLRERRGKGLVIYVTAGDPTLDATGGLLEAVDQGGADVIELGIPFSDPLADGPVIQRASERAVRGGATLRKVLERLPGWREKLTAPVVLFTYFNPVLQYGLENFARDAARAGVDGALIVDLTPEEAGDYIRVMRSHHLDTVFLVSPTSSAERIERVAAVSTGFLYLVSRTGVTGERQSVSAAVQPLVERARHFTSLPLAVGFGVSTPAQVQAVQSLSDAAVVGSAVVHAIEERYAAGGPPAVRDFVAWLKGG